MSLRDYFSNNRIFTGTEKPTQGKFGVGDIIVNIGPNSAEEPMWICVEAGTPGVWELCSGVNEEEITNIIQSNAITAVDYTDGVDIQIDGGNIGNMNELQTTDKSSIVGAINELFQSANNGKQLIANAIGEPVSSEDTFQAMSNDINSLLSQFKTNMMNSGVMVESSDKFKQLIDKIKGLIEGEGNKGLIFESNTISTATDTISCVIDTGATVSNIKYLPLSFNFEPTIILAVLTTSLSSVEIAMYGTTYPNILVEKIVSKGLSTLYSIKKTDVITTDNKTFKFPVISTGTFTYYAIGVGEEDTTLRDSLASILQEEGVSVTEEDDMASLISKVDEEFENKKNIIEETKLPLNPVASDSELVRTLSSITIQAFNNGVSHVRDAVIQFNDSKFSMNGVTIYYTTGIGSNNSWTNDTHAKLEQLRDGAVINTLFNKTNVNINTFGSYTTNVTDVKNGDIFRITIISVNNADDYGSADDYFYLNIKTSVELPD